MKKVHQFEKCGIENLFTYWERFLDLKIIHKFEKKMWFPNVLEVHKFGNCS